jgi:hypothetical protein
MTTRPFAIHSVGMFTRTRDDKVFDLTTCPRDVLIALLEWNDPNGCYSDAACTLEFGQPSETETLRAIAWDQFWPGGDCRDCEDRDR